MGKHHGMMFGYSTIISISWLRIEWGMTDYSMMFYSIGICDSLKLQTNRDHGWLILSNKQWCVCMCIYIYTHTYSIIDNYFKFTMVSLTFTYRFDKPKDGWPIPMFDGWNPTQNYGDNGWGMVNKWHCDLPTLYTG